MAVSCRGPSCGDAMSERLFASLAARLRREAVVLATVLDTRGATPRKGGSRMLVTGEGSEASVGGGMLESRVVEAARRLLRESRARGEVQVDLTGRPGAAGICGGSMRIALRRWFGDTDRSRAEAIARGLAAGVAVELDAGDLGAADAAQVVQPDPRLLVIGGGHCGAALHDLAKHLDFDLWAYDEREEVVTPRTFPAARRLSGEVETLVEALVTPREVYAVCLNRDYAGDVAALRVICRHPPRFIGMMGSRKRIAEVLAALPEHADTLRALKAPVGLAIGAQTPHEIAVSILAQLLQARRRPD